MSQVLDRQLQELRNILKRSPVPSVSGSAPSEAVGDDDVATGNKEFAKLLSQVREEQAKILTSSQGSRRSSGDFSQMASAPALQGIAPADLQGLGPVAALLQQAEQEAPQPPKRAMPIEARSLEASTQTDLLQLRTPPAYPSAEGPILCWSRADDDAQTEALRRIELLRHRSPQKVNAKDDSTNLDRLNAERKLRQDAEKQLAQEKMKREATQQQVLCLEYELDGKETQLQEAERQLEEREGKMQPSLEQSIVIGPDTVVRGLRTELEDKDRQLELKENEIKHLLRVLNQHGSTALTAEDRLSSTYSAYPTMSFR